MQCIFILENRYRNILNLMYSYFLESEGVTNLEMEKMKSVKVMLEVWKQLLESYFMKVFLTSTFCDQKCTVHSTLFCTWYAHEASVLFFYFFFLSLECVPHIIVFFIWTVRIHINLYHVTATCFELLLHWTRRNYLLLLPRPSIF